MMNHVWKRPAVHAMRGGNEPPIRPYVGAYGPASRDTIFGPIMRHSPTPSAAIRHRAALRSRDDAGGGAGAKYTALSCCQPSTSAAEYGWVSRPCEGWPAAL